MIVAMLEGPDLLIVAVLVMLLFGAKRLPEFARGLGQAKKEFEQAQRGDITPTTASSPESTTPTASHTELATRSPEAHDPTTALPHNSALPRDRNL